MSDVEHNTRAVQHLRLLNILCVCIYICLNLSSNSSTEWSQLPQLEILALFSWCSIHMSILHVRYLCTFADTDKSIIIIIMNVWHVSCMLMAMAIIGIISKIQYTVNGPILFISNLAIDWLGIWHHMVLCRLHHVLCCMHFWFAGIWLDCTSYIPAEDNRVWEEIEWNKSRNQLMFKCTKPSQTSCSSVALQYVSHYYSLVAVGQIWLYILWHYTAAQWSILIESTIAFSGK